MYQVGRCPPGETARCFQMPPVRAITDPQVKLDNGAVAMKAVNGGLIITVKNTDDSNEIRFRVKGIADAIQVVIFPNDSMQDIADALKTQLTELNKDLIKAGEAPIQFVIGVQEKGVTVQVFGPEIATQEGDLPAKERCRENPQDEFCAGN